MKLYADPNYYVTFPVEETDPAIRFLVHNSSRHACIVIQLEEDTARDDVKRIWPIISKVRKQLIAKQGNDLFVGFQEVLYTYSALKIPGRGYTWISQFLNFIAAAYLINLKDADLKLVLSPHMAELGDQFSRLVLGFGFSESDRQAYIVDGLQNIAMKKIPWPLDNGLFTAKLVEKKLTRFQEKIESSRLKVEDAKYKTRDLTNEILRLSMMDSYKEAIHIYLNNINNPRDKKLLMNSLEFIGETLVSTMPMIRYHEQDLQNG